VAELMNALIARGGDLDHSALVTVYEVRAEWQVGPAGPM
jgi:hypothetical protein